MTERLVVPPKMSLTNDAAATILQAAIRGPVFRDSAARSTGLSAATVNRQVRALLSSGLLRERHDLATSGGAGRPRVPFDIDTTSHLMLGVHIGVAVSQIVAVDLAGRVLARVTIVTPSGPQSAALTTLAREAQHLVARLPGRDVLWVGIASAGHVRVTEGLIDHEQLGWFGAPAVEVFGGIFDVPVSVAAHIEAMAAAELLLRPDRPLAKNGSSSILYVYVRETVGAAVILNDRVHVPPNGPGTIAHLPTRSSVRCPCGRVGCLEATVADSSIVRQATEGGLLPAPVKPRKSSIGDVYQLAYAGSEPARELLDTRAEILGGAIALVSDVFHADRIILAGQAITAYEPGMQRLEQALLRNTTLSPACVSVSRFGNRIQEAAAAVTALDSFYFDPLAAVRRTRLAARFRPRPRRLATSNSA